MEVLAIAIILIIGVVICVTSIVETKRDREIEDERRRTKPKRCSKCKRETLYYRRLGRQKIVCEIHLDDNGVCKWCNGDPRINKWDSKYDKSGRIRK